ncbi:MAG: hypothetical protein ABIS86_20240, partial [Streptosporangiaceae bacterium]
GQDGGEGLLLNRGLFILMLGIMITGFSQPTTAVKVPRDRATIMVAIDVSLPEFGLRPCGAFALVAVRTGWPGS